MSRTEKTNAMRLLDKAGIPYETLEYPSHGEAIDAGQVAVLLGEPPEHIFKTLVLRGSDQGLYACLVSGNRELDLKKAAAFFQVKSLQMLAVTELKDATGYVRGGCSPLCMKKPPRTAVDSSALKLPYLIVSGGRIGLQLKLKPDDLIKAAQAEYAALSRD